jgi:hypothetical protein
MGLQLLKGSEKLTMYSGKLREWQFQFAHSSRRGQEAAVTGADMI